MFIEALRRVNFLFTALLIATSKSAAGPHEGNNHGNLSVAATEWAMSGTRRRMVGPSGTIDRTLGCTEVDTVEDECIIRCVGDYMCTSASEGTMGYTKLDCGTRAKCTVICHGYFACFNTEIVGAAGQTVSITTSGRGSMQTSNIDASLAAELALYAYGFNAVYQSVILCPASFGSNCTLTGEGYHAMGSMYADCGGSHCVVSISGTQLAAESARIRADDAASLKLHGTGSYAMLSSTITCPQTFGAVCSVFGDSHRALLNINLYCARSACHIESKGLESSYAISVYAQRASSFKFIVEGRWTLRDAEIYCPRNHTQPKPKCVFELTTESTTTSLNMLPITRAITLIAEEAGDLQLDAFGTDFGNFFDGAENSDYYEYTNTLADDTSSYATVSSDLVGGVNFGFGNFIDAMTRKCTMTLTCSSAPCSSSDCAACSVATFYASYDLQCNLFSVPTVHNIPFIAHAPTLNPTAQPSRTPSLAPSVAPSVGPTTGPSSAPSGAPSGSPSVSPSLQPSSAPSSSPTSNPSLSPSSRPSLSPSSRPSLSPSTRPSLSPSTRPSLSPSTRPSLSPSTRPSLSPSTRPSLSPSTRPSLSSSTRPSLSPSTGPSLSPSTRPSLSPSLQPSSQPSLSPLTPNPSGSATAGPSELETVYSIRGQNGSVSILTVSGVYEDEAVFVSLIIDADGVYRFDGAVDAQPAVVTLYDADDKVLASSMASISAMNLSAGNYTASIVGDRGVTGVFTLQFRAVSTLSSSAQPTQQQPHESDDGHHNDAEHVGELQSEPFPSALEMVFGGVLLAVGAILGSALVLFFQYFRRDASARRVRESPHEQSIAIAIGVEAVELEESSVKQPKTEKKENLKKKEEVKPISKASPSLLMQPSKVSVPTVKVNEQRGAVIVKADVTDVQQMKAMGNVADEQRVPLSVQMMRCAQCSAQRAESDGQWTDNEWFCNVCCAQYQRQKQATATGGNGAVEVKEEKSEPIASAAEYESAQQMAAAEEGTAQQISTSDWWAKCTTCGQMAMGSAHTDGVFYCNGCWGAYAQTQK